MFVCIWAHVCAGVHARYAGQRTTSVSFLRHCPLWPLEPGSLTGLDLISEANYLTSEPQHSVPVSTSMALDLYCTATPRLLI